MKSIVSLGLVLLSFGVFAQKVPAVSKTEFSKEAVAQKITSLRGKKMAISEIINNHKGRILIIDFWASWCPDCIKALPSTKILKEQNPQLDFVYFSLDRSYDQWKRGLDKYDLTSQENYWFDEGWKNNFNNYIDLNWVPRFLVVDQSGKIAKYYSISPTDPDIQKTIDELKAKMF
ncbi:TlpA family protein disulfide reductase [Kaistella jeonii]|uniref:Alkyl hydroperoxide reductase n=1 Tax=Kaistella jeonii TaxID=266749 RepID=A0A0C1F8Y6_9FLAO|nr:thioredoxin-like domain-containing protein [Kaistella jeonii]KIA88368.1 alkyl hydroperoxide reductase [Kaistella jeonii]SFC22924.1 Thiol-disulfide isomerase or thioredoxin [Kaistella jeonii]VEI94531.1 thiol-disulfide oxidoreductase [Kaistella jeonii]